MGLGSNQGLVLTIILVSDDLPPQWQRKWEQLVDEAKAKKFSEFEDDTDGWCTSWSCRLGNYFDKHVHEPKLKRLLPVIQELFRLLPDIRTLAAEALVTNQKNEKRRGKE